jgi:ABC-2 type transport system permease protein
MIDTYHLLRGKVWIVRNSFTRPARLDRLKSLFFFCLGAAFFVAIMLGSMAFFQKLAAEQPFGTILVHKLVEFLFLTFFTVLIFSSIVTSLNSFFLDSDMPLLVTAPISFGRVYLSRYVQTLVMTGWMVIMFGLPVFLSCGIVFKAAWYFYPWIVAVLIAFVFLPVAIGSLVTILLVRAFPARKMQDILVILAVILIVALYFLFRFLRPERLFNPDIFTGFAEYFATLKTPNSPLLPSTWGSLALLAPLDGKLAEDGVFYILQLLAWGFFSILIGAAFANRFFLDAFTKSQEGRRLRITGLPFVQTVFSRLAGRRDPVRREFFLKEIRGFFRDTSQWTQLLLLLGLIIVYLFNFKALDLDRFAGVTFGLRNMIGYVNMVLGGFVMSAICVRFVLPAISLEGKAIWIIRTAPISFKRFVWGKFRFYVVPVFIVSEILIVLSNIYLGTDPAIIFFSGIFMGLLSLSITALAIGIGAMYPNFEEKTAARMATGVSSIIYMSFAFGLILAVIAILSYGMNVLHYSQLTGSAPSLRQWILILLSFMVVLLIIAASVIYPMRKGIESLNKREL